jgi:hypothetical protein
MGIRYKMSVQAGISKEMSEDMAPEGSPENGPVEWLTALRILGLAYPHFRAKRGMGLGQMILKYQSGECKIIRVNTDPPTMNTYRVQILGSGITVEDKST